MTWALKVCTGRHDVVGMRNSNGREPVGTSSQSHGLHEVVRVYERLAGQNRWTGVAYDAASGSVVATASGGTRAATRDALERASAPLAFGASSAPRSEPEGQGVFPLPDRRRRAVSVLRAR